MNEERLPAHGIIVVDEWPRDGGTSGAVAGTYEGGPTVAKPTITALITERCAANSGEPIGLDVLERLIVRDLVSLCDDCTDRDPIYHLEPGISWFMVNRVVRDGW